MAAVLVGIAMFDPHPRAPWWLLAIGQFCLVAGSSILSPVAQPLTASPLADVANAIHLVGYPIVTLGFALLVIRRPLGASWSVLLDGGILTAGIALLVWVAFADPLLSQPGLSQPVRAIEIAFLLCDVAAVGVLACLLLGSEARTPAVGLFFLGMLAMLVAHGLTGSGSVWTSSWPVQFAYFAQYGL